MQWVTVWRIRDAAPYGREEGSPTPFSPELYRLAAEMSAPYGWDMDLISAAAKGMAEPDVETAEDSSNLPEKYVEFPVAEGYNKEESSRYRLRFMSSRDQFYRNLDAVEPLPGYQDIACHADAYGFAAQDPETGDLLEDISVKELAYRILDSGKYNGGPVRLLACSSGALEDGAAQQLADLLKVPVLAPMDTLFTSADGYMAVASTRSKANRMMGQMSKQNKKWSMEGWKIYEPRER